MDRIIRVLVVDDSAYIRKVVSQMLSRSPFIQVVGTACDGEEALEQVEKLDPDVVTLDLMMPRLDGVGFLRKQMARRPIPVVVVSIASESSQLALSALDAGAVEFVQKPTALATEKVFEIASDLVRKVKAAAEARLPKLVLPDGPRPNQLAAPVPASPKIDIIVLGVSTGGPQALKYLIPQLPADFPVPIAIVLHMPVGYTELYAKRLNEEAAIEVHEAWEGEELRPGLALLACAGKHLTLARQPDGRVLAHLDTVPLDLPHRPSVDVLFRSAAETYGPRVLGIIMTGMGNDGLAGAAAIKSKGGRIITEAEESCVVYGMPRSVVEAGLSDRSVALHQMAPTIFLETMGEKS